MVFVIPYCSQRRSEFAASPALAPRAGASQTRFVPSLRLPDSLA